MVLVDTSVWIDHLRKSDEILMALLEQSMVYTHPMVVGELACGNLNQRQEFLRLLQNLPAAIEASHEEALFLLEAKEFMGRGIGYVDLHLLAATQLSAGATFWTRDQRLQKLAVSMGIGYLDNR